MPVDIMLGSKACPTCGAPVSLVSNRLQKCSMCGKQVCNNCGIKSPSQKDVWACREDYDRLTTQKKVGFFVFCSRCHQFGQFEHIICPYCNAPSCLACAKPAGCVENHRSCGNCTPQLWSADAPAVVLTDPVPTQYGPRYLPYQNASFSSVRMVRCSLDKYDSVKASLLPPVTLDAVYLSARMGEASVRPSKLEFACNFGSGILMGLARTARTLGLSPEAGRDLVDTALLLLPQYRKSIAFTEDLVANITMEPELIAPMLSGHLPAVIEYFLKLNSMNDERRIAAFSSLPVAVARSDRNLMAMTLWARSRGMKSPSDGLRALEEVSADGPLFDGVKMSLDGTIACDHEKCLQGLRTIRNERTADGRLVGLFGSAVEAEVRRQKELAPGTEAGPTIRIEKLHLGDMVAGSKVGSHIDIKDSVINRSEIGGGGTTGPGEAAPQTAPGPSKFCPNCGCRLGPQPKFCPDCGNRFSQ